MLVGLFINGYKSYSKSIYIPIADNLEFKYSAFIGNNGIGKSAILEAIDVFFNNREWNMNKRSNKEDMFISLTFLVNKMNLHTRLNNRTYYTNIEINANRKSLEIMERISEFTWDSLSGQIKGATRREHMDLFFKSIDEIKTEYNRNDYYLLNIGVLPNSKVTLKPFHNYIQSLFINDVESQDEARELKEHEKDLEKIKKIILDYYAYVYIPVEQNTNDVLKIEARQMQTLMDRDVLQQIDSSLESNIQINGKNKTFLKFINEDLDNFMESVNTAIQTIDKNYSYATEAFNKRNLTASDIREKILEAYFIKRTLKHNEREISQLSSGEQRRALIDIAYAFLSNKKDEIEREIILAIDEPELSLNIANCFNQFTRLEELAIKFNNQVLLTTHWYGFLPVTKKGYINHLMDDHENDKGLQINQFKFYNYLDEQRRFPDDIELKSMFDLAGSILTFVKTNHDAKWIICEGSDDKLYLEAILNDDSINILPVGGCSNVVKLYNLLMNPLTIERREQKALKGRILCLIDTDEQKMNYLSYNLKDSPIQLRRLQIDDNRYVKLIEVHRQGQIYKKTEIEDCLAPWIYYNSIKKVVEDEGNIGIQELFQAFEYNKDARLSQIEGDFSILLPKNAEGYKQKRFLVEYLSKEDIKHLVAKKYSELLSGTKITHQLAKEIFDYFNISEKNQDDSLKKEAFMVY